MIGSRRQFDNNDHRAWSRLRFNLLLIVVSASALTVGSVGCTPIYTSATSTVTLHRIPNLAELQSVVSSVEGVEDITETPASQGRFLFVFPVEHPAIISFRRGALWGQLYIRSGDPNVELRAGTFGTRPTEVQRQQSRELLDRIKAAVLAAALPRPISAFPPPK